MGSSVSGTMREHVVLSVADPLPTAPSTLQPQHGGDDARDSLIEGATQVNDVGECDSVEEQEQEKEEDLTLLMVECRICQEDDTLQNLDIPCACKGTLKVFLDSKQWNWGIFGLLLPA